jgi:RNA polymerase sigma-70 factor (ECF subfamily)
MTVTLATDDRTERTGPPSPEFVRLLVAGLPSLRRIDAVVADPWLRDDVVQEALRRAFASWRSYDPGRPMGPWLWRLAMVSLVDLTRGRSVPVDVSSLGSVADEDGTPGSDDHVVALDRSRAVQAALDALTPGERALLWRRDVERLPYEVLASLGASASAPGARMAVSRARRRLRAAYLAVADTGHGCFAGLLAVVGRWRARLAQRAEPVLDRLLALAAVPTAVAVVAMVAVPLATVLQPEGFALAGSGPPEQSADPASELSPVTTVSTSTTSTPARVPARTATSGPGGARPTVPPAAAVRVGAGGAAVGNGGEQQTPVTPGTDAIWYGTVEVKCDRSVVLGAVCAALRATPVGEGLSLSTESGP